MCWSNVVSCHLLCISGGETSLGKSWSLCARLFHIHQTGVTVLMFYSSFWCIRNVKHFLLFATRNAAEVKNNFSRKGPLGVTWSRASFKSSHQNLIPKGTGSCSPPGPLMTKFLMRKCPCCSMHLLSLVLSLCISEESDPYLLSRLSFPFLWKAELLTFKRCFHN